jgi:hypothetical protein
MIKKSFKSRTGPTGPRTAAGKAKSSQNATKHRLFTVRLSNEEDETMATLADQINCEFKLRGALECEIGYELTRNRLETQRINRSSDQEFQKAEILAEVNLEQFDERHTPLFRCASPTAQSQENYRSRLRPKYCVLFLMDLKKRIEKRGPCPDEDLGFLYFIYGHELTSPGEAIVRYYTVTKSNGAVEPAHAPDQTLIVKAVEREIEAQNVRAQLEDVENQLESVPGLLSLPIESVMDRIQKYRTANARAFGRLLGNLETVRRLKG